jgi:hypothetical protein
MTALAPTLDEALFLLAPISLEETVASVSLQTRVDRKYVVTAEVLQSVFGALAEPARALENDGRRVFGYRSIYFDTPDRVAYRRAARSRPDRFKVRTRIYLDSGLGALEVKTRDRSGRTVKVRLPYEFASHGTLTEEGRTFVAGHLDVCAAPLAPVLDVGYDRTTLVLDAARVTVDRELRCRAVDADDTDEERNGAVATLPDALIVETKTGGRPCAVDLALWGLGCRPMALSKYGVGMAVLDPSLPANRWNRVLRRHFGWVPVRR